MSASMARTTANDKVHVLHRTLYRAAKADPGRRFPAEPLLAPDPVGTGGEDRMPAVNNVGEPCAGESHARFDGRVLETELLPTRPSSARQPPRQRSTLRNDEGPVEMTAWRLGDAVMRKAYR